jgi:broad specificity phosphatase PhoE
MRKTVSILLVLECASLSAFADPAVVLLIRHAEKQPNGRLLSQKGWQRARALPHYFISNKDEFGPIAAIFAMAKPDKNGSVRAEETLKPLAKDLNLPENTDYTADDANKLVKKILKDRSLDGKTVLISWNHEGIPKLAKEFGIKDPPTWPSDTYDMTWKISPSNSTLKIVPQNLLPGDSIHVPPGCPSKFAGLSH